MEVSVTVDFRAVKINARNYFLILKHKIFNAASVFSVVLWLDDHTLIHANGFKPFKSNKTEKRTQYWCASVNLLSV